MKFDSPRKLAIALCLGAAMWMPVLFAADPATKTAAQKTENLAELEGLEEQAFKQAAALVSQSVVQIRTVGGVDRVGQLLAPSGPTSGTILTADGYIVSSAFNFVAKPTSILVILPDGRKFDAKIVARDQSKMLTLLKIDAKDLLPVRPSEKKSVQVGNWAIALGRTFDNPQPSLSVGIVSALNRIWGKAIQTDAKISPVNYGGPLVDIEGKVMGILVPLSPQQQGDTAGVEWYDSGIGFAIPLEDVLRVLPRLQKGEDLSPGLMGIEFKGGGLVGGDPVIERVRTGSPADKAGIKAKDVVLEVDGLKIVRDADIRHALGSKYAGDKVAIVVRRNKETVKSELTLVDKLLPFEAGFLGVLPQREATNEPNRQPGVGVRYVFPDSPAAKAGLKPRDRIVEFAGLPVNGTASLTDSVVRTRPGQKVTVVYVRDGAKQTAEVTLTNVSEKIPEDLPSSLIPTAKEKSPAAEKAAGGGNDKEEAAEAQKPADSKARTGRFTSLIPGTERSYWAVVPDDYNPAYQYGMMVWIHPPDDTMEAAIVDGWKRLASQRGLILVGPKAEKISGWTTNESDFVGQVLEEMISKYTIDPARIFVHSHGKSGEFAFQVTFKHVEQIRAAAVIGAPVRERPPENHPARRLQFLLVVGEKDPLKPLVEASAAALRREKFPTTLEILKGADTKYPTGNPLETLARWADSLDRI